MLHQPPISHQQHIVCCSCEWVIGIHTNIEVIVVSSTTLGAHRSPRAKPDGWGELPRSLMRPQRPKLRYQFLFYYGETTWMTSNGSWCMGIKGEMSGTVCVTFTWYMYIYIWVVYSFCLFCCLFIIVTTQIVALYKPCKPKPKFR